MAIHHEEYRPSAAAHEVAQERDEKLRTRAKRCGADIFFLDEAGVRSDSALQRTWGAKGETPVVQKLAGSGKASTRSRRAIRKARSGTAPTQVE